MNWFLYDKEVRALSVSARRGTIVIIMLLSIGLIGTSVFGVMQYQQVQYLESKNEQLQSDLNHLQGQYESLMSVFEEPLESHSTPTISQVRSWLVQDDTDECDHVVGEWTCGDFSAMLMTRAKAMNWRIRIAVIFLSLEGDSGYGSTTNCYGSYGHTINLIECTDGEWYIEPQTDATWYFVDQNDDRTEFQIHHYYNFVDSDLDTLWDGYRIWTNFYAYFA